MRRLIDDASVPDGARQLLESTPPPRGPRPDEIRRLVDQLPKTAAASGLAGSTGSLVATNAGTLGIVAAAVALGASLFAAQESRPPNLPAEEPRSAAPRGPQVVRTAPEEPLLGAPPRAPRARPSPATPSSTKVQKRRANSRSRPVQAPPVAVGGASPTVPSRTPTIPRRPKEKLSKRTLRATRVQAPRSKRPNEIVLIDRARIALEDNPQNALRDLQQHLKHYPTGLLADERDYLMVKAAMSLRQAEQARDARARLSQRSPESAYLDQIEERWPSAR